MAVLRHFRKIEKVSGTRELDIRLPGRTFLHKEGLGEGTREHPARGAVENSDSLGGATDRAGAGVLDSIKERLTSGKIAEAELAGMMRSLKMAACKSPNLMQDAIKMLEDAIRLEPGGRSLIPALLGNIGTRGGTYLDEVDLRVEELLKRVCTASDVEMLLGALNWQNRLSIERIIVAVSDETSAPALREVLRSGNHLQMACVIPVIGRIRDAESVPVLTALLEIRPLESDLRAEIRELGWNESGLIPEYIRRQDEDFRINVIASLGMIGDARATVPLMALLDDRSMEIRKSRNEFFEAFGMIGDADLRPNVIASLGMIGDARATVPLMALLDDRSAEIRREAIKALGRIGEYERLLPAMISSDKRRMISLRKSLEAFVDGCGSLDTIQDFLVRWDRMLVENLGRISEELKEGELDRNLAKIFSRAEMKEKKLRAGEGRE